MFFLFFYFENRTITEKDIPDYTETAYGYCEWFAKVDTNKIYIVKEGMLAPNKKILTDEEYKDSIKMMFENSEKFIDRYEAYEIVRKFFNKELEEYKIYISGHC